MMVKPIIVLPGVTHKDFIAAAEGAKIEKNIG